MAKFRQVGDYFINPEAVLYLSTFNNGGEHTTIHFSKDHALTVALSLRHVHQTLQRD